MPLDKTIIEKLERYCAYQERCRQQIKEKMKKLGVSSSDYDDYLVLLAERDFWNEGRFAEAFASGRFRMKGWGPYRIQAALKAYSVSDEHIRAALSSLDEQEIDERLGEKMEQKRKQTTHLPEIEQRRKCIDALVRQGYGMGDVIQAWEDLV